jgi:agmatine deiminase
MDGMFHEDEMLKARLCKQLDLAMYPVDVCMEGGGVVMDGDGTMITNEQCMMHKTRNPELSKTELENDSTRHLERRKFCGRAMALSLTRSPMDTSTE